VVAWSYSAHELLIALAQDPALAQSIDGILLLSPTEVRIGALEGLGVQATVLVVEGDVVYGQPGSFAWGPGRLQPAHLIPGATVIAVPNPGLNIIDRHDDWFRNDDLRRQLAAILGEL